MTPIVLKPESLIVKFIAFMIVEKPESWEVWRKFKGRDSCSLNLLIGTFILFFGVIVTVDLVISLFFGAGLWTWGFFLISPDISIRNWRDLISDDFIGGAVLIEFVLFLLIAVVALAAGPVWLWQTKGKYMWRKFMERNSGSFSYDEAPPPNKLFAGIEELYSSFKNKYCRPVKFESDRDYW